MRQCSPPGLRITGKCCKIGRYSRSYILTKNKGRPQFKADPTVRTHNKSNGHCCRRSLHNHSQDCSYKHKKQYGYISHIGIVLHKSQHFRVLTQIGRVVLQIRKPHKQERETKNKFTDRLTITFLREEERNTKS